jgi:hypothetical protein
LSIRPEPRKLKLSTLERTSEDRVNMHKNPRLTPLGRERMVLAMRSGRTPEAAAQAAGVCPRTARKWFERFGAEGRAGLLDRSSRPLKLRRPTPAAVQAEIVACRQRLCGKHIVNQHRRGPPIKLGSTH